MDRWSRLQVDDRSRLWLVVRTIGRDYGSSLSLYLYQTRP
nr:MAG TPA: hypothetical protein [Caudoviricetes sp.]